MLSSNLVQSRQHVTVEGRTWLELAQVIHVNSSKIQETGDVGIGAKTKLNSIVTPNNKVTIHRSKLAFLMHFRQIHS